MATVPLNGARDPFENLLSKLAALQATATGWRARCPACQAQGGLAITVSEAPPAVLSCQAGCRYDAILAALRLPPSQAYRGAPVSGLEDVNTPRPRAI